jgi:hypothetical protein
MGCSGPTPNLNAPDSLIQKGLIWSPWRGQVDFTVPLLAEFLLQHHPIGAFDDE